MKIGKYFCASVAAVFIAVIGPVSGADPSQPQVNTGTAAQPAATVKTSNGFVVYLTKDGIRNVDGKVLKEGDLKFYQQQDPETGICLKKGFRTEDWELVAKIFEIPLVPKAEHDSGLKQFWNNMLEGLGLTGNIGIAFTVINLIVLLWFFWRYFVYKFTHKEIPQYLTKIPTMVGMMGTLYSLISMNMANPTQVASQFSIAIASTFFGIIVYLVMILLMKDQNGSSSASQGE